MKVKDKCEFEISESNGEQWKVHHSHRDWIKVLTNKHSHRVLLWAWHLHKMLPLSPCEVTEIGHTGNAHRQCKLTMHRRWQCTGDDNAQEMASQIIFFFLSECEKETVKVKKLKIVIEIERKEMGMKRIQRLNESGTRVLTETLLHKKLPLSPCEVMVSGHGLARKNFSCQSWTLRFPNDAPM